MPSVNPPRGFLLAIMLGILAAGSSCSDAPTTAAPGRLEVRVASDVPLGGRGKRIEIIRPGQTDRFIEFTNDEGRVEFVLKPEAYILIAVGIQGPGPGQPYDWRDVQVRSGETTVVELFNCGTCN